MPPRNFTPQQRVWMLEEMTRQATLGDSERAQFERFAAEWPLVWPADPVPPTRPTVLKAIADVRSEGSGKYK